MRKLITIILLALTWCAFAQENPPIPTLNATTEVPFTGCYVQRCFPVAVGLDRDTALMQTTTPTLNTSQRDSTGAWVAGQIMVNPDFTLPENTNQVDQYTPLPPFGYPLAVRGDSMLVSGTSDKYGGHEVIYVMSRANGVWSRKQVLTLLRGPLHDTVYVADIAMNHAGVAIVSTMRYGDNLSLAQLDVYVRRNDGTFSRRGVIYPPTSLSTTGYTIALSGDNSSGDNSSGDNHLLVGDPSADNGRGRAYIYEEWNGWWLLRKILRPPASAVAGAAFGSAVAIDRTALAVSAPEQEVAPNQFGAVYLYDRDRSGWQFSQTLTLPDPLPAWCCAPEEPPPQYGWRFGEKLAMAGDRVAMTASMGNWYPYPPLGYLAERRNGSWTFAARLVSDNVDSSTSVFMAGSTILIGAYRVPYNYSGELYELSPVSPAP